MTRPVFTAPTRVSSRTFAVGVAASLVFLSTARADRGQIDAALEAMEAAVLAGDKDAYLATVWQDDANFLQEQKAWAADFDRHRAVAFDLRIDEKSETDFGDTEARFTLVMAWSMGAEVPRGGDRRVTYPVVFKKHDGVWLYAGEDWQVVNAPGVDGSGGAVAKYLGRADHPANVVVEILPEGRAHVDEGFENTIDHVQEVKLYNSMEHLQASIYLSYTDGLGGWNEPGEAIKVMADGCRRAGMARPLLAHEYGHCATFAFGPETSKMPWWVLEGVAELAAEKFGRSKERVGNQVRSWARDADLAPWEEMADFYTCPDKWHSHVYAQGHHFVGFVSEKWGRTARNKWLRLMAQGKTLDGATREAFELSFAKVDRQWRQSLTQPAEGADATVVQP